MNEKTLIRVKDVMRPDFDLVDGMETVAEVLKKSEHPESKCFIIDTRHENDEYGIVLLSDIAKKVLARNRAADASGWCSRWAASTSGAWTCEATRTYTCDRLSG